MSRLGPSGLTRPRQPVVRRSWRPVDGAVAVGRRLHGEVLENALEPRQRLPRGHPDTASEPYNGDRPTPPPHELRRIVEFLNGQMDPAEVVAVEVRQYVGESGLRTLVPRVVGQTVQAEQKKSGARRESRQRDEPSFLDALERDQGPAEHAVAVQLLDWARARGLRLWWGKGAYHGSFLPMLDLNGEPHFTFGAWSHHGTVEIQFQHMRAPFGTDARKRELLDRIKAIPGVALRHENLTGRPSLHLSMLAEPDRLAQFLAVFDWMIDEVRAADLTGRA